MRALIIIALASGGCLANRLRAPVSDHKIQATVVAQKCRDAACETDLQAMLDEFERQAVCLDAIVKRQECPAGE